MPFKLAPWDFPKILGKIPEFPSSEFKGGPQIYSFLCTDPFLHRICRELLFKHLKCPYKLNPILGSDLTIDWVEENFMGLSLFGEMESYIILQAEEIKIKVREFLLNNWDRINNPFLFLSFFKDEAWNKKNLMIKCQVEIEIEETKFWETAKLLDFLVADFSLKLSREAKEFLLESVENGPQEFWQVLNQLQLLFPHLEIIEKAQLLEIISPTRIDNFAFCSLYAEKKIAQFYGEILKREFDFDSLRSLFSFLQTHLLKMSDPLSLQKKEKLNRYEQDIIRDAKKWKKEDIQQSLRLFGNLEIMCKQRNPFLWEKIRSLCLATLQL